MQDDLLEYYNRELAYLRRMGAEFATSYSKVAQRLLLEENKCEDPHVERLLEGFAFLAARTRRRIDEDLPELTEGLLDMVAPQHVRPIPSFSLVEFTMDSEQGTSTGGYTIATGTTLYARARRDVRFRTCYETTLWPLRIEGATWGSPMELKPPLRPGEATAALSMLLECEPQVDFSTMGVDSLRFYLNAEGDLAGSLYELLLSRCSEVVLRDPDDPSRPPVLLAPSVIQPVGFAEDEGLVPFEGRGLLAHRILLEFFTFPKKFLFLDIGGLEGLESFGRRAELVFLIRRFEREERSTMLETGVSRRTFRLGCTPVANLFDQRAEPIMFGHDRDEYLVVPDSRRRESIRTYSIDRVDGIATDTARATRVPPLYSARHRGEDHEVFWCSRRRGIGWRSDQGSDVYLRLVDRGGQLTRGDWKAIGLLLTCHNGDLPSRLPIGVKEGDFEAEGGGPFERITGLVKPTPVLEPPLGKPSLWTLISQVSLNHVSLVEGGGTALKELLRLHDRTDRGSGQKQIDGLRQISSRATFARIRSEHGVAFARGHQVELLLDEGNYTGVGAYLFASVLERFLGLYVALNSFSALRVHSDQRLEPLADWQPRAGDKVLL